MVNHRSMNREFGQIELDAEIRWYEARLKEISNGAESAYEKALARSFEQALSMHRARRQGLIGN